MSGTTSVLVRADPTGRNHAIPASGPLVAARSAVERPLAQRVISCGKPGRRETSKWCFPMLTCPGSIGLSRVASDAAKKRSPFSHRLPLTASSTKRPSGTRDSGRQCHLVLHFGWRLRRAGTLHAQRWKHVRCGLPSTSPLRCSRLRTKFRTLDSVFNSDLIVNTCLHSGYISTAAVSQLQTFSGCQQIMSDCIAANTRLKNVVLFFSFVICIASYSVSSTFVSTASLAATLQPSSCKVLQSLFSCLTSLAMLCASVNISVLSTFYSTPPVSAHEEP